MSFAFIDAKGDEPAVLAMHPRLSARRLFAKAQAAAGRKTGTFGQGWVEDQSLMLQIDKPISGLVRKVRRPIKAAGFRVARVVLAQADGSVFEEDVTDEGEDGDDGDASADGMRGAASASASASASATASAADARDPTTVDAGGDEDPDADAARWRRAADRFTPLVTAALAAGECDTARLQAIWQFARDKAASGQHDVALGALKNLVPLLTTGQPMPRSRPMSMPTSAAAAAATAASTTTKPTGDDARADASRSPTAEPDEGQALLQELKTRFPAFRDALAILPDRTREATRLIQDIPHHVQVVDLPAARAAMARLDILVEDAARHLRARREVELRRAAIGERFLRLTGLPAGAQTQRLRLTEAVMPHVTHDRDASWAALEAAMTPGDPTRRPPAGVTAIERDAVRARFDNTLRAPAFDVEPALVIDALIMCRLGLSEDDVARARACDRLRAELTAHPDIRSAKILTRPADADLMDRLERLRIETEAVDRGAIGRLESMRRDASVVFQAEGQSPLLRAWEYTLTALAERASGDRAMQQLQEAEMKIVEQEAHDLALRFTQARDFRASGVARQDVRDIEERLMAHYRKVFAAGTSAGYDAAVRTDLSPDGQSGRGVWCLYDIQGIDDPDQWIKIEDAQAYGRLVQGMMMLAWKQAFGRERDPAIAAMSRRLADALAERLLDDEVADRLARQSEAAYPGRRATPWRLDGSGVSTEAKEVLDERTPRVFVVDAPADARDLLNRLGQHLRTLWTDPASGLKASAERHGDAATVSTSSHGTHAFSLVPGAAGFRQLLDDPRDFAVALEAHVDRERGRWKQALEDTVLRTREDVALQCQLLLGKDATSELVDAIWTAIGARPTMRAFCDSFTQLRAGPGREPPAVTRATLARHVVEQLAPPVAAAELEGRLGQVAKALAVPSDRRAAVVRTALATLTRLDPVQAGMTDIRAAMAASMREHGLDEGAATQQKVSNALRPPAGLIFADTNWGDAERRVKLALVVHPFTGEPEVWKMHDDNSQAEPAEPARYVHRPWHVRT